MGGGNRASGVESPSLPSGLMTTEHAQQSQEHSGHTRSRFLTAAGGAAGAAASGPAAGGGASAAPVLGGGVFGLGAAHELAERGYAVTVYEYYDALGGKARSMGVPGTGTGTGGRKPLPGACITDGVHGNLRAVSSSTSPAARPDARASGRTSPGGTSCVPRRTRRRVLLGTQVHEVLCDGGRAAGVLLRTPTPVVHGHLNCLDSPRSVTAIGRARCWDVRDFPRGVRTARGQRLAVRTIRTSSAVGSGTRTGRPRRSLRSAWTSRATGWGRPTRSASVRPSESRLGGLRGVTGREGRCPVGGGPRVRG